MHLVLEKAIELALEGDKTMIKLLLEQHMSRSHHEEDDSSGKSKVQVLIQNTTSQPAQSVVKSATVLDAEVVNESKE